MSTSEYPLSHASLADRDSDQHPQYLLKSGGTVTGVLGVGDGNDGSTQVFITSTLASRKGLIVRGPANPTANLQEWQTSEGATRAKVEASGSIQVGGTFWAQSPAGADTHGFAVGVYTPAANRVGLLLKGTANQTANLLEVQDSAGAVLAAVGPTGTPIGTLLQSSAAPTVQTFTSSGTWTKPAGAKYVRIELWSGGASGLRTSGSGSSYPGGGGGGYVTREVLASTLAATVTATVGAGGAASGTTAGNAGGSTSFGPISVIGGQPPGNNSAIGGTGGGLTGPSVASSPANPNSTFGGGAGGGQYNGAGSSEYGGGGGGGVFSNTSTGAGGLSTHGGNGGAGGLNVNGTAGSAPGGGGGASNGGSVSGAGGRGEVRITTFF